MFYIDLCIPCIAYRFCWRIFSIFARVFIVDGIIFHPFLRACNDLLAQIRNILCLNLVNSPSFFRLAIRQWSRDLCIKCYWLFSVLFLCFWAKHVKDGDISDGCCTCILECRDTCVRIRVLIAVV